jgi:catechol 2,3-dioxygenase-like lactoylglutathione lyase family enzyme
MRIVCPLIAVSDLKASKDFYEKVLGQRIVLDLGWNVTFSGGFAIQLNFADIVSVDKRSVMKRSHNFELFFEEEDFDSFTGHLKQFNDTECVHKPKKHD